MTASFQARSFFLLLFVFDGQGRGELSSYKQNFPKLSSFPYFSRDTGVKNAYMDYMIID